MGKVDYDSIVAILMIVISLFNIYLYRFNIKKLKISIYFSNIAFK